MANEDWSNREIDAGGQAVDREIDRLKRVYKEHSDALAKLARAAPTKALAKRYHDLIGEINRSILALDDPGAIVSRSTSERPIEAEPPSRIPASSRHQPATPQGASDVRLRTEPGRYLQEQPGESALGRIILIFGMAIIVIALLGFFVWKFGSKPRPDAPTVEQTDVTKGESAAPTPQPLPVISATPEAQDFGVIYKGTRVAKTFDVFNNSDHDVSIRLERSKCRCLWFDYPALVPAGGKVTVSVTVDGGRASEGLLSEAVVIALADEPQVGTEVQITAEVR